MGRTDDSPNGSITSENFDANGRPSETAPAIGYLVAETVKALNTRQRGVLEGRAVVDNGCYSIFRRCITDNRKRVPVRIRIVGQDQENISGAVGQHRELVVGRQRQKRSEEHTS